MTEPDVEAEVMRRSLCWAQGPRQSRELADHALGDLGRQQRLAGGDRAHRLQQLLRRVVLEHEAAGAGVERVEDVLVQRERRQDEDARRVLAGEDAPRRLQAVELGHADVHQHDGRIEARHLGDRLAARAGLRDDLDVRLAGEQHAEAGPDHGLVVGDQDADAHVGFPFTGRRTSSRNPKPFAAPAVTWPP